MNLFKVLFLFLLFHQSASAQVTDTSKIDDNPKLTKEESAWLNKNIKTENFNFDNKCIGFFELNSGGFYGIGKFTMSLKKKNFFSKQPGKHLYRLYPLTAEEKKQTMGYDALLVVASKKIKGKMRRLKKAAVLEYTYNRYVQIPAGAGSDNNPVLSEVNAAFFNELYRTEINPRINIDFTGKKLAIFETHCSASKMEQKTIAEYVERVKKLVAVYGYASTEVTCILNEKQKEESGGYDIIIQYKCKMNLPVERVIDELKKNRQ